MTIRRSAALVGALALLTVTAPGLAGAGTPAPSAGEERTPLEEACGEREVHPPILVDGSNPILGFTVTNPTTGETQPRPGSGVVGGNGTADDPFRIEGWCIPLASSATGDGIRLEDTDAHVLIQGNVVTSLQGTASFIDAWGVWLAGTENVVVEDNEITSLRIGLRLEGTQNTLVRGNTINHHRLAGIQQLGLSMDQIPSNDAIVENTVRGNDGYGVSPSGHGHAVERNLIMDNADEGIRMVSDGTTVRGNTIEGNEVGLSLRWSHDNLVEKNTIQDNPEGLAIVGSEDNDLVANNVTRNGLGIRVGGDESWMASPGTAIHANNIWDNAKEGIRADGSDPVDATENWWGCPDGPSDPSCDDAVGDLLVDPWREDPNTEAGAA